MKSHFDYVVVGGGSAGCVLANRLSENPGNRVLLIEAGPRDRSIFIKMPAAFTQAITRGRFDWGYTTDPEKNLKGRPAPCWRGRVLGGSSSINAMSFVRGHPLDFDSWANEHGLKEWSFAHCLPYFKRFETFSNGETRFRGGHGPVHVTAPRFSSPLQEVFLQAAEQAGYPRTADTNGAEQEGFGVNDQTIHRGRRVSAASAYIEPIQSRKNLLVELNATVTRVLFDEGKAIGIEYLKGGRTRTASAAREVILCAGAINSPKLLMLSGIGPAGELSQFGIPVVVNRPEVGKNLQDHVDVSVKHKCTQPVSVTPALHHPRKLMVGIEWSFRKSGWGATNHFETVGYVRTNEDVTQPNIQYMFIPLLTTLGGPLGSVAHGFQATVMLLRPRSRGRVKLKSPLPDRAPSILYNYLRDPEDLVEIRQGIKRLRDIFSQPAFDAFRGPELDPGPDVENDEDIDDFIQRTLKSTYHPCGTCRMGSDGNSVVDEEGRVRGVERLRVVDASIFPTVTSGNINAPTLMVAEKLSDYILGKGQLASSFPY